MKIIILLSLFLFIFVGCEFKMSSSVINKAIKMCEHNDGLLYIQEGYSFYRVTCKNYAQLNIDI